MLDDSNFGGISTFGTAPVTAPRWPDEWVALVESIRESMFGMAWEIFAGASMITQSLSHRGWVCAPPVDIAHSLHFDVLNPLFTSILVGIILEGRVTILVLDPPDGGSPSSLSTLNVAETLAGAMFRTGGHVLWIGEKPLSVSLSHGISLCSCRYGTPWCKSIPISSSHGGILTLGGMCDGCHGSYNPHHFQLGPIQSHQIWPQLADAIAACVDDLKGTTVTPKCTHLAGFGAPLSGDSMLSCLQSSGFRPSGGRALSTVSSRVAACVQPSKRLAPTILPEGLGPASHLAVALQTEHPFSRPPQMDPHVESAITLQPDPVAL